MVSYPRIRKSGNSFVVTVSKEEMERLGIQEGEQVAMQLQKIEIRPVLSDELKALIEESWKDHEAGYRYLAGR